MMIEDMQEILGAFKFGFLQDALTFNKYIKDVGLTLDDVREYIKEINNDGRIQRKKMARAYRRRELAFKRFQKIRFNCPDCGHLMGLYTGDNQDCQWLCKNCRLSIYKGHSFERELIIMSSIANK
jgi:hypothetical protein